MTGRGAGGGGTLPQDILATAQRPDLVILNRTTKEIVIFELTVPWDMNVETAHNFKQDKYASLVNDLSGSGYAVGLFCFEVSVRGQITASNRGRLKSFLFRTTGQSRSFLGSLCTNISKVALLGSFSIFTARNEGMWSTGRDLSVQL